jgi:hypothetical protein
MVTEVIRKHRVYKRNVYLTVQDVKQIRAEAAINGVHMGLFDILYSLSASFNTREEAEADVAKLNKLMADAGSRTYFEVRSWMEDQVIEHDGGFLNGSCAANARDVQLVFGSNPCGF